MEPHANAPVIGNCENFTEAGATWNVFGNFTGGLVGAVMQVGSGFVYPQVKNVTDFSCQVVIPNGLAWGVWAIYLVNEFGPSRPYLLNKPVAWWVGPDNYITRGDTIGIFGECLTQFDGYGVTEQTDFARVILKPTAGGASLAATVTAANPGRVQFTIPAGATNGTYKVQLHNGHGYLQDGVDVTWTKPIEITVGGVVVYDGPVVEVDSYSGSDIQKITAAITYAKTLTRPTVKFAARTYNCTADWQIINNCRFLGAGKNLTKIQCDATTWSGAAWLINAHFSGNTGWTLEDLEIAANGKIVGDINLMYLRTCKNYKIHNCRINAKGCQPADFHHSSYGVVTNTDIIGKIWYLGDSQQIRMENYNSYGTNDTLCLIRSLGAQKVCISGGTWQHLDVNQTATDEFYGIGRCFVNDGTGSSARNIYIARNTAIKFDPRPNTGDLNQGEKILAEANQDMEHAQVVSSTATVTTMPMTSTKSISSLAAIVKITKGKGMGQVRLLKSFTEGANGSFEVTEPWTIIPDSTSVCSIGHSTDQWYIYKNNIEGQTWTVNSPSHVASEGISSFGGCNKWIIKDNVVKDCRWGSRTWNTQHNAEGYPGNDSSVNIQHIGNTYTGCRWARGIVVQYPTNSGGAYTGLMCLGNIGHIREKYVSTLLDEVLRVGSWENVNSVRNLSYDSVSQQKLDISLYFPNKGTSGVNYTNTTGLGK